MEEVNGTIEITRSGFGVLKRFIKLPNVKLKRCRTRLKKVGFEGTYCLNLNTLTPLMDSLKKNGFDLYSFKIRHCG